MDRSRLVSAALFLTILGSLLFLPPLANVFQQQQRLFGLPLDLIYLFACWIGLIAAAGWLGRRLPRDPESNPQPEDEG
jgi:cell division protein FtsX